MQRSVQSFVQGRPSSMETALIGYEHVLKKSKTKGSGAYLGAMAELGRRDLFFLLTRLMGREDALNGFVFQRCREVRAAPDGYLDLWAREHFKSTIITCALTIQDLLNNPELSFGIFSHTRNIARSFLKQIKRELEGNAILKRCYPDVLYADPHREAPQWSDEGGIVVKRRGNPKEASVEAWGLVEAQPTGRHFQVMVYDDVVTLSSVRSPLMIAKVTEAWALSLNLGASGGARRYIGTRYHFNDTYGEIIRRGAAIPRIYPATLDGTEEGPPVLLPPDELAEKRRAMGPYIFGCQMLQNPRADSVMGFQREWLRHGEAPRGMNLYLLCDPAGSKKAGSDYTVMLVIGLGPDGNYYLVDGLRDRLNLAERGRALFRLHRLHRPLAVGYERYGMQADIEHIRQVQEAERYRFAITELGGRLAKNDRIRRLIPLFEQGRIFLPPSLMFLDCEGRQRDLVREFTNEEYLAFPTAAHDDMLDCLARITDPELSARFPAASAPLANGTRARNEFSLYD